MTKDEALKLALSALDEVRQETFRLMRDGQTLYAEDKVWSTIIFIKEVLAQEQEPVAWMHPDGRLWTFGKGFDKSTFTIPLYTTPPQRKPEQEPVAWWNDTGTHIDLNVSGRGTPLYTTPPQRKPLTKDEICAIGGIVAHGDVFFINIKQLNQLVGIKE